MGGRIDLHPNQDPDLPELDLTASPDHGQDLVHTVVQSPGHVLHADLDQDHALGTHDQNDILDQDLEVLTTREDLRRIKGAGDIMEAGMTHQSQTVLEYLD